MPHVARVYLFLTGCFTAGISLIASNYVLFLLARGMGILEANIVNAFFMAGIFFFEIPTGVIADLWGRKASFVLASVFLACSMFAYSVSHSLAAFIAAELIGALGFTCASGAFQAWMVDELERGGYPDAPRVLAEEQIVKNVTLILGGIIGAKLAEVDPALPWRVAGVLFCLTAFLSFILMRERGARRKIALSGSLTEGVKHIGGAVRFLREKPELKLVLAVGFAQFFAVQAPNMQWQMRFTGAFGMSALWWIWAGIMASLALGAFAAKRLMADTGGEKGLRDLLLLQIWIGVSIALAGRLGGGAGYVWFLAHEVGRGIYPARKNAYLNARLESEKRATLLSVESMVSRGGSIAGLLVSGWVAERWSIAAAWQVSGAMMVVAACILLIRKK